MAIFQLFYSLYIIIVVVIIIVIIIVVVIIIIVTLCCIQVLGKLQDQLGTTNRTNQIALSTVILK